MIKYDKIWKFELEIKEEFIVYIPLNSIFLDLQIQNGKPVIWCQIPKNQNIMIPAKFNFVATGQLLENLEYDFYQGTIQDNLGLVWHVYYNSYGK